MRDSVDRQTLTSRAPVGYQRSQLCSNYGIMRSNGRGYVKPSALHLTAWVMKPRLLVYVITSPCSSISSRGRKLTICDFDMESESIGSNGTGKYWKQAIIMKKNMTSCSLTKWMIGMKAFMLPPPPAFFLTTIKRLFLHCLIREF
jgi:hypothetical protein